MVRRSYTPEQIIGKLREAEVHLSQGLSVGETSRKIGVTEQTYYRWRKEYGGMRLEQAKRLKDLEKENARLKKLVADLSLDNSILQEAARLIVGQAKKACDLIQQGTFEKAVSVGGGLHHAKPSYGEGFCLYNDVAFCALYLIKEYGLQQVLILDTDAHAGNGTAQYFYDDPRVLLIDLHQDPNTLYPGTRFVGEIGSGKGEGFTINVPLPIGADDACYELVFDSIVEPLTKEFKPEIIVRNDGSDPAAGDELTSLALSAKGFRMIGERVSNISTVCDGRVIDLIASGYNSKILPYAWLALITGLAGINAEPDDDVYLNVVSIFRQDFESEAVGNLSVEPVAVKLVNTLVKPRHITPLKKQRTGSSE